MLNPEWDGESYCTCDGCTAPATAERPYGTCGDEPITELVCADHVSAVARVAPVSPSGEVALCLT